MATSRGQSFLEPGTLVGPYPSGAPAIFIDQVARLGQPCGMIGCVGDDDFGLVNFERLRADGVDVSAISVHPGRADRKRLRHLPGERRPSLRLQHPAQRLGPSEASPKRPTSSSPHRPFSRHGDVAVLAAGDVVMRTAIERVKARGGTVSFDPNSRKELPRGSDLAAFVDFVIDASDIVLPSGPELLFLTGAKEREAGDRGAPRARRRPRRRQARRQRRQPL